MTAASLSAESPAASLIQPRRAAFWLFCIIVLGGLHTIASMILTGWAVMPVSVAAGIAAWAIYPLPLLLLLRWLGVFRHQTASSMIMAFAWGGLGAVYLALPANQAVLGILAKVIGPEFTQHWGAAIAGPWDEEALKLIGVVLLVLITPGRFRTVASVMGLGVLVGLGFQVVEDLSYTINGAINHPNADQIEPVVKMLFVRGVLCGLWSHAAYTAITSFGVGYFVARRDVPLAKRLLVAVAAFIVAVAMHAIWNSPIPEAIMKGDGLLLGFLAVKGLPVLIATLLLWRVASRQNIPEAR